MYEVAVASQPASMRFTISTSYMRLQDLAVLWEMHVGGPSPLAELDDGSSSDEDVEEELQHSMSRQLAADDRQTSLKGQLRLRYLWLAFWAGTFLRERFGDARWGTIWSSLPSKVSMTCCTGPSASCWSGPDGPGRPLGWHFEMFLDVWWLCPGCELLTSQPDMHPLHACEVSRCHPLAQLQPQHTCAEL